MTCRRLITMGRITATGLASLGALLFLSSSLFSAEPVVSGISPGAAAPGVAAEIALVGADLTPPLQAWTSLGIPVEIVPGATPGTTAVLKLTVPAECGGCIASCFISSSTGNSNVFQLVVDDLPTVQEVTTNHAATTPQVVTLPVGIDAQSEAAVADYFQFDVAAGAGVSFEVVGARLGSDFDPLLRVLTPAGQVVAKVDDDGVMGADCRLRHVFAQAGSYLVEVRDSRHRAGGRYRLRLGDFPLVTSLFPAALPPGAIGQLTAIGPATANIPPIVFQMPKVPASGVWPGQAMPPRVLVPGGKGLGIVSIGKAEQLDLVVPAEAAGVSGNPVVATLPQSVSGRLEFAGDVDTLLLPARVGDRLRISNVLDENASSARLALRLYQPSGPLAGEWLPGVEGELLQFVATEAGLYRLTVEDLFARGGEDYSYRLQLDSGNGFALHAKPDKALRLMAGVAQGLGMIPVDIQISRFGYTGPVKIQFEGAARGFQIYPGVIPENAAEARQWLVPPADFVAGQLLPFRLVGEANIAGDVHHVTVSTQKLVRAIQPAVAYPPRGMEGIYRAVGLPAPPAWFKVQLSAPPVFAKELGLGSIRLGMDRVDASFKDSAMKFIAVDLPAGVTIEEKRPAVGPHEDFELVLKGPKELAPGVYPFRLLAYAEQGGTAQGVRVVDTVLTVGTPLQVQVPAVAAIAPGAKGSLVVNVVRLGKDAAPIQLLLANYPAGVTGPAEATIAADQTSVTLELAVAADAAVAKSESLQITANSMLLGQPVSIKSALIGLEVRSANP